MSAPDQATGTVVGIFLGTLFITWCLIYIIRHCHQGPTIDGINTTGGGSTRLKHRGLDRMIIETFPLINYTAVKHTRASQSPLECAVCLSEFLENDILRLLPGCQHVFHTNCIDTWLAEHITCPVCRSKLSDPVVIAGKHLLSLNLESDDAASSSQASEQVTTREMDVQTRKGPRRVQSAVSVDWERFTLNLPEDVMKEIMTARRYQRSVSMQDYTYQGKASWRDAKIRALLNCISCKRQGKEKVKLPATPHDVSEARQLLGCSAGGDGILEVGCMKTEIELTNYLELNNLPVHERV